MTTKHTPGPCACTFEIVPTDPSGRVKGHIFGGFRVVRYCPLHAAAPDLLAALTNLVQQCESMGRASHTSDVLAAARAAIALATRGQP